MRSTVGSASVPTRRTTISHALYSVSRSKRYRQTSLSSPSSASTFSVHSGNRPRTTQTTLSTATRHRMRNGVESRLTFSGSATANSRSIVIITVSQADISFVLKQRTTLQHRLPPLKFRLLAINRQFSFILAKSAVNFRLFRSTEKGGIRNSLWLY